MDHQRFRAHLQKRLRRSGDVLLVERYNCRSFGRHALGHFQAQLAWNDRFEMRDQAIGVGTRAPTELDDVAESSGCDQAAARQLAFQQCIGRNGSAVDYNGQVRGIGLGLRERSEYAFSLVFRRARHLGVFDYASLFVEQDKVGKCTADVATHDRVRHPRTQCHAAAGAGWPAAPIFSRVTRVSPYAAIWPKLLIMSSVRTLAPPPRLIQVPTGMMTMSWPTLGSTTA